MLADVVWRTVAPRPDADWLASGVLCLDCIERRQDGQVGPEDVKGVTKYGDHPTYRATWLTLDEADVIAPSIKSDGPL